MYRVGRTIVSEYNTRPRLREMIERFDDCLDPTSDIERFYRLVLNLDTAEGYGLDAWGRIVGIGRVIESPAVKFFGFAEAGDDNVTPFNIGPFFSGVVLTNNIELGDEAYRRLIFAKAAANITDGSAKSVNALLVTLFPGRGNAYVRDDHPPLVNQWFSFAEAGVATGHGFDQAPFGDLLWEPGRHMRISYVFEFPLSSLEKTVVQASNVLPRPTGVSVDFEFLGG